MPLDLLLLVLFKWRDPADALEPPLLLRTLNFLFSTAIMVFVAYLAARSYQQRPYGSLLLLGSGSLLYGLASLLAGAAIHLGQINTALTIFNTAVLFAGICHFSGSIAPLFRLGNRPLEGSALVVAVSYGTALTGLGLLSLLAWAGFLPRFFTQGQGPSMLRQGVLFSAMATFTMAGMVFLVHSFRDGNRFYRWYGLGLVLIATGLLAVLLIDHVGSPLGWVGRGAQYLGGLYILIGTISALQTRGNLEISLGELIQSRDRRFRLVVENCSDGIHQLDLRTNCYTYVSPSQEKLTGFSQEELRNFPGQEAIDRVHPEDRPLVEAFMESIIQGHCPPGPIRYRWKVKDGRYRWFSDSRSLVCDQQGRPHSLIGVTRDIDDQKQAEDVLAADRAELEQRVAERTEQLQLRADQLSRLTSELALAEERERRRMANVLHDHLQQMLVGVKFSLENILHRVPPELEEIVARACRSADQALELSNTLTVELSPPILHEQGLMAGLEWLVWFMEDKHGLEVDLETDSCDLVVDEDIRVIAFQSVREILFNIVKHAGVKHAKILYANNGQNRIKIRIQDHGCGFDPAVLDRGRQIPRKFGLLSIRERVSMVGGQLEIDSAPGEGARLAIHLPVRRTRGELEAE